MFFVKKLNTEQSYALKNIHCMIQIIVTKPVSNKLVTEYCAVSLKLNPVNGNGGGFSYHDPPK